MPQYLGWTNGRSSTPTTASQQLSQLSLGDSHTPRNPKIQTEQKSETYKQPTKHPPNSGQSPRVLSPIESCSPTPTSSSDSKLHVFSDMTPPNMAQMATLPPRPPPPPPPPPPLDMPLVSPNHEKSRSKFDAEKVYVDRQRATTFSLRSTVQQIRKVLRQRGDIKAAKDDELFQRVRGHETGARYLSSSKGSALVPLLDLISESQKARDEYGPLEDECLQLEDRLYSEESRLYKLEEIFYSNWTVIPTGNLEGSFSVAIPQESPTPTEPQQEDFDPLCHVSTSKFHPLTEKFLSELGDLDLLRERYDDVMEEKEHLEEQRESRKLVKLHLGAEEHEWLKNSTEVQNRLYKEMQAKEQKVDELREECLLRNLVDQNDNPTEFQDQERQISDQEAGLDSGSQLSVYKKFSALIPRPGIKAMEPKAKESKKAFKSDPAMTRINEWLLENLRLSPLEIVLLANTFEMKEGKLFEQWQLYVLRLWYEDTTIKASKRLRASSMNTQAPVQSDHSDTVGNFRNDGLSYRIFHD